MRLTEYQQDMLDGKYGKGKSMAMEILTAVGDSFEAQRMVPITRAHVSLSAQEADVWFAGKMRDAGAGCAVAPTVNPGYSLSYFQSRGLLTPEAVENMERTHQIYQDLGAIMTYSCTPYLFGNIPRYGEVVSFSETSVTIYANSVIGAKTNRESAASALCAAITGFTPEYGMLLEENRHADILVEVQAPMEQDFDFSLLGLMGQKIGKGVPVFLGLPEQISTEGLINLGTQLNVSGACERFHIPGVTPDAPTLQAATAGHAPKRRVIITRDDLEEALARFSPALDDRVEFVILGCPHYTYHQLAQVGALLQSGPSTVPIWILTSAAVKNLAQFTGLESALNEKGVELVSDTCVDEACCWGRLAGKPGITDSPKASYYMRTFGVRLAVRETSCCLRLAQRGRGN